MLLKSIKVENLEQLLIQQIDELEKVEKFELEEK